MFQYIVYRYPVLAGGLHAYVCAGIGTEPHPESFLRPLVKIEKRLDLYVVIPLSSVDAMQATTNFLWKSIPQQMGYMIFNKLCLPS